MPALTAYVANFLSTKLKDVPGFVAALPGGVHRGVAKAMTPYPFLTFEYVAGASKPAVLSDEDVIGGNLLYLLRVTDKSDSAVKAQEGAGWLSTALSSLSGASVLGGFVYCEEVQPYDMAPLEQDVRYQQIGGTYRFYVDKGG
jgi:hypothetical protein